SYRHSQKLNEQHHVADGEVPGQGSQENQQVEGEENEVEEGEAGNVHGVPELRLGAGKPDGLFETATEISEFPALAAERLDHANLPDDLGEPAGCDVDILVLLAFPDLP